MSAARIDRTFCGVTERPRSRRGPGLHVRRALDLVERRLFDRVSQVRT